MAVELTCGDIRKLKTRLEEALRQSEDGYQRLMHAFREKDQAITPEGIRETMKRWVEQGIKPGRTLLDAATVASCNYQRQHSIAERCLVGLGAERPDKQAIMCAAEALGQLWQAIAGLAVGLNGDPLNLSYRADFRAEDAQRAARVKHAKTRRAKEQLREVWAAGEYETRDECADEKGKALGLSFSAARKALRGTPDPKRS